MQVMLDQRNERMTKVASYFRVIGKIASIETVENSVSVYNKIELIYKEYLTTAQQLY